MLFSDAVKTLCGCLYWQTPRLPARKSPCITKQADSNRLCQLRCSPVHRASSADFVICAVSTANLTLESCYRI